MELDISSLNNPIRSKKIALYFSPHGEHEFFNSDYDRFLSPYQKKVNYNNYSVASSSYNSDGLSNSLLMLNYEKNEETVELFNQIYGIVYSKINNSLEGISYSGSEQINKTASWILSLISIRGGLEYKNFDKFNDIHISVTNERNIFKFVDEGFSPTNNHIHNTLEYLLKNSYVAQGISEGMPILVATSKIDSILL